LARYERRSESAHFASTRGYRFPKAFQNLTGFGEAVNEAVARNVKGRSVLYSGG
jgi:hypothetical protein